MSVTHERIFNLVKMGRIAKMTLKCRLYVCTYVCVCVCVCVCVLKHCLTVLFYLCSISRQVRLQVGGTYEYVASNQIVTSSVLVAKYAHLIM
jgi:hypothetical protein